MECGEGIEERHTQQQHSVPGHAERGEEEGFTSSRQEGNCRTRAGDSTSSGKSECICHILVTNIYSEHDLTGPATAARQSPMPTGPVTENVSRTHSDCEH